MPEAGLGPAVSFLPEELKIAEAGKLGAEGYLQCGGLPFQLSSSGQPVVTTGEQPTDAAEVMGEALPGL